MFLELTFQWQFTWHRLLFHLATKESDCELRMCRPIVLLLRVTHV